MVQAILRRCATCRAYTLRKDRCPHCGGRLENPHPPRFSPQDRYQEYRVAIKVMSGIVKVRDDVAERILRRLAQSYI